MKITKTTRTYKQINQIVNKDSYMILDLSSVLTIDTTGLEKIKEIPDIIFTGYRKELETSLQLGEIESNQMIKEKTEAIDSIVRKIHQKLRVIL